MMHKFVIRISIFVALACVHVQGRFLESTDGALDEEPEVQVNGVGIMDLIHTSNGHTDGTLEETIDLLANDDFQDVIKKLGMNPEAFADPLNTKLALKLLKLELLDQFVAKKNTIKPYTGYAFLTSDKFAFGKKRITTTPFSVAFELPIPNAVVITGVVPALPNQGDASFEVFVSNVTQYGFQIQTYGHCTDPSRTFEVEWLAISEGHYVVGSRRLRLQVGKKFIDGETEITLKSTFKNNPSVVANIQNADFNNIDGAIPRIVALHKNKFVIGLQTANGKTLIENKNNDFELGYFTMEQGVTSLPRYDTKTYLTFVSKVTTETYNDTDNYLNVSSGRYSGRPSVLATISRSDEDACILRTKPNQDLTIYPREEQIKVAIKEVSNVASCDPSVDAVNDHFVSFISFGISGTSLKNVGA